MPCDSTCPSESDTWAQIRVIWETSDRWGAQWIIDAYGFDVTADQIRERYRAEGWEKRYSRRSRHLTPEAEMAARKKLDTEPSDINTIPADDKESRTKYDKSKHDNLVYRFALLGATLGDIADAFGVSQGTIAQWRDKYPSFRENLYRGKMVADANVAHALYKRAIGMHIVENKVHVVANEVVETPVMKEIPPDISAAKFWLINRAPHEWKERVEVQENVNMQIAGPSEDELDAMYERALEKRKEQRSYLAGRRDRLKMIGADIEDAQATDSAE